VVKGRLTAISLPAVLWSRQPATGLVPPNQELPGSGALLSSFPAAKRTFRAGTTVEMACLYTIWLTLFFNKTTN
jgi:hypothetical protein